MFPGLVHETSYSVDTYKRGRDEAMEAAKKEQKAKPEGIVAVAASDEAEAPQVFSPTQALRLLFIPFKYKHMAFADWCNEGGQYIPAVLSVAGSGAGVFVIHFHGNACDNGQVGVCALREGYSLNAHYLLVEYPRYGFARGFPSESLLNSIAKSVYDFVVDELRVPPSRIVLIGRSVGCGPVCHLASHLERQGTPASAIILQSPYTSIRDTANDLIGCVSWYMFDRWANWKYLAYTSDRALRQKRSKANIAEQPQPAPMPPSPQLQLKQKLVLQPQAPSSSAWSVSDCLCFRAPDIIQCPVLFIHADHDQIIDYHHSVTMHALRTRDNLPSELFTQVSTPIFTKDHNHYDYDNDVIIPSRDFLAKYIDYSEGVSVVLPVDVLAAVCTVPPEYQDPQYREQLRPSAAPAATAKQSSSTPTRSPSSPSPIYIPPSKWTACLAVRCVLCCPLCFCTECTLAITAKGLRECYYAITGQAPAFQYATRAERRKSGGIPHGCADAPTEQGVTWKTIEEKHVPPTSTLGASTVSKLLRKGEKATICEEATVNPMRSVDIIPHPNPKRLSVNGSEGCETEVNLKNDYVPG